MDALNNNKLALERYCAAVNTGDIEHVRRTIDEVVEADATISTPLPIPARGAALLKEVFTRLLHAFPDLHITIEDLIAEGDKVVARNTVTGTHRGHYMYMPATGKSVRYNEIIVCRFRQGRITETWGVVDVLTQMRQLGAIASNP